MSERPSGPQPQQEIRAMVLAAGRGERLRPITDTTPKPLVRVGGRPLIDYALECVARAGIRRVVINLHHLGHQIREYVGDGSRFGLSVDFSPEDPLQDTGGGIRDARRWLGESTFVTLNSDTIVDVDLAAVIEQHRDRAAAATLVLQKHPQMEQFGLIRTEPDGRIGAFLQHRRPGAPDLLEPFMYTGVQVLEPSVFHYMPAADPFSITRVTYPAMLAAGERLYGYEFSGTWITVGTPGELAEAEERLSQSA